MTATVIAFSISFAGLVVLFGHKVYEIKKGRSFLPQVREKADAVVEQKLYVQKDALLRKSSFAVRQFFSTVQKTARAVVIVALHEIHVKLTKLLEKLKGVHFKKSKGMSSATPSSFLKNVGGYKEEVRDPQQPTT